MTRQKNCEVNMTGIVKSTVNGNMVDNKGFVGMFVGYPEDHAEKTYVMWNAETRRPVTTRSVQWLDQSYGETMKVPSDEICRLPFPKFEDNEDDYELLDIGGIDHELKDKNKVEEKEDEVEDDKLPELVKVDEIENQVEAEVMDRGETKTKDTPNMVKELKMESFNPNPENVKDQGRQLRSGTIQDREENDDVDHGRKLRSGAVQERVLTMKDIEEGVKDCDNREFCFLTKDLEEGFLNADLTDPEFEPTTFQEAWHHPNEKCREKWREAIRKKFRAQINKGVYRKVKRRDVPNNKRCIKCK